jgi:hypothetical protein
MKKSLKAIGFFDIVSVDAKTQRVVGKRQVKNMVGAYGLAGIAGALVSSYKGTGWQVVGVGTSTNPNSYEMTGLQQEITAVGYARKTLTPTTGAVGQLQLTWSYQSGEWYDQSVGEAGIFMNAGDTNIRARATFPASNKSSETQIFFTYQVNFRTQ